MLEARHVGVSYDLHTALSDADIQVAPGEIVVILGANGAGKSTLLKSICGICEGSVSGDVLIDGASIARLPAEAIVERGVAFVPEGRGVFGDLTVEENLLLGAYSKHARQRQSDNLRRVLDLFPKLAERSSQTVRTMSGGEQQMVAIGRALMSDPQYLLLDEPSLGLSPILCKELFQTLAKVAGSGLGVLMVEQNAKQSLAISNRGYLIENGMITGQNEASALLSDPAVQAAYLGGASSSAVAPAARPAGTAIPEGAAIPSLPERQKTFISPSSDRPSHAATDDLAGESIAAVVARAERRSVVPAPEIKTTAAPAETPRPNGSGGSDDPEIKRILSEMEAAARAARNGKAPETKPVREAVETYEDLPDIPVFRKSEVKVFRRGPDGKLVQVEQKR